MTIQRALLAALPLLVMGSAAEAVGDPPVRLNQRQATDYYRQLRFLLGTDYGYCGDGQVPRSGLITGGGNPMGGSQTTVIRFNRGAQLKVVRMFQNPPAKRSVTVQISCA